MSAFDYEVVLVFIIRTSTKADAKLCKNTHTSYGPSCDDYYYVRCTLSSLRLRVLSLFDTAVCETVKTVKTGEEKKIHICMEEANIKIR